jgi:hypothetical protein
VVLLFGRRTTITAIPVEVKDTSFVAREAVSDRSISAVWNLLSRLMKYRKRVGSVKLVERKL